MRVRIVARRVVSFVGRMVRRFLGHHGLVLASAIAFDTLLSVVPALALGLVVTSYVVDPEEVKAMIASQLDVLIPGAVATIVEAYTTIVEQRGAAGGFVMVALLIFGAMAFRTMREALAIVFDSPPPEKKERKLLRAVVPLLYVLLIGLGILVGTVIMVILDTLPPEGLEVLGIDVASRATVSAIGRLVSFLLLVLFFSSFYRYLSPRLPPARLSLLGGLFAASLWELTRRVLIWYFGQISMVGVVYGSLASVIVLLVSLEIAAVIVLLGGQLIAEVERSSRAGLPWYQEPRKSG